MTLRQTQHLSNYRGTLEKPSTKVPNNFTEFPFRTPFFILSSTEYHFTGMKDEKSNLGDDT